MPVIHIWKLKLVMSTSLEDTARVRVATVDWPGESVMPSWFHVRVNGPFALAGLQLVVVMFKVRGRPLLVFLM
jgi:hypothetical protein